MKEIEDVNKWENSYVHGLEELLLSPSSKHAL
jgi:hypothetical protein